MATLKDMIESARDAAGPIDKETAARLREQQAAQQRAREADWRKRDEENRLTREAQQREQQAANQREKDLATLGDLHGRAWAASGESLDELLLIAAVGWNRDHAPSRLHDFVVRRFCGGRVDGFAHGFHRGYLTAALEGIRQTLKAAGLTPAAPATAKQVALRSDGSFA